MRWSLYLLLAVVNLSLLQACNRQSEQDDDKRTIPPSADLNQDGDGDTPQNDKDNSGTPVDEFPEAPSAYYKLKPSKLLARDLSAALNMSLEALCQDQGDRPCFQDIHNISLGGVAPYKSAIYTAKAISSRSAIAMERSALIACRNRVEKDLTSSQDSVILHDRPSVMISQAFQRILSRDPTPSEIDTQLNLLKRTKVTSAAPKRDWGLLLCYSLVTSTEFLFY
ncbi:hypothetical protein [Pseudobacteriovorax antillogorgiicola]|uniref:DUF1553 domain-containing protein n=1 Tax=Pseudobacteriovorax antillogorgiicola TaxID=1513793 RepID=A0A1Y6C9H8_9BACT|nr:hypothetical protein [Pseudobacteriovorax antillogorgiicola]TCS49104.1 hypothetical protein EDD56_116147 [Pseudobacteriovorax antillogorgiicola]SMF51689.1 hypothetical protein SAMN06296036_1167 [Pseudobacteriovorax antillogorgiicola]